MTDQDQSGPHDDRKAFRAAAEPSPMPEGFAKKLQRRPRGQTRPKAPSPVTLRLTDEEKAELRIMAAGMTVSAYIRQCVFGRSAAKRVVPSVDRAVLAQILARLGGSRMANNLNQIAHHANCGSLVMNEGTEAEIKRACANIAWMRLKLIEALGLKNGLKSGGKDGGKP